MKKSQEPMKGMPRLYGTFTLLLLPVLREMINAANTTEAKTAELAAVRITGESDELSETYVDHSFDIVSERLSTVDAIAQIVDSK